MKLNPKYIPYIVAIIAIIFTVFYYQKTESLKLKALMDIQNQNALLDSIRIEYNKKTGEVESSKAAFVLKEKELKEYNKVLADELAKEKGKVVSLNRAVIKLKQDTTMLRKALRETEQEDPIAINDSTYRIPWNLLYQYDSLNSDFYKGSTEIEIGVGDPYKVRHIFTEIRERESRIEFVFGQKVENGMLRVFVRSKYPGFTAEQLDGVLIDPNTNPYIKGLMKKKHWFTGFGIGPNMNMGYDFINARPALILGVGLQYNVYQW